MSEHQFIPRCDINLVPTMRMEAYWYSFEPTGVYEIDRILCAVASAGKSYHNTECWTDEHGPRDNCDGKTPVEWIQNAANAAAVSARKCTDLSIRITEALEALDDLERSTMVQGGFPKMCLRKIRSILKGENHEN